MHFKELKYKWKLQKNKFKTIFDKNLLYKFQ